MTDRLTLRGFLAFPFLAAAFVVIFAGALLALPCVVLYTAIAGDEA